MTTGLTPVAVDQPDTRGAASLAALRRFVRPRPPRERCDLCAADLPPEHQHLFSPKDRQIGCACDACAILFSGGQSQRFTLIPRRGEFWPDFQMDDLAWGSLNIPINLAFMTQSSAAGKVVAYYPSPAGAIEAMLGDDDWRQLIDANPRLSKLTPDVEALLVNRIGTRREHFRAPIDECYKLVGLIRTNWRGLSGGAEVWKKIDEFFLELRRKST